MNIPTEKFDPVPSTPVNKGRRIMWDRKNQKGNQEFLSQLNDSISLDFEFVLALSLSAIFLVIGYLTDQMAIFILALIVAPIFYSVIGFSIGFDLATLRFIKTGIFSWLVSFLIFILSGTFAGFISKQFSGKEFLLWKDFLEPTWASLLLLGVGVVFLITIYVRNPKPKSIIANVAISYVLILPLSASGFALGNGQFDLFITGLKSYFILFGFAVVIGIVTLLISGIRPQIQKIWSPAILILLVTIGSISIYFNNRLINMTGNKNTNESPAALSIPNGRSITETPTVSISETAKIPLTTDVSNDLILNSTVTPTFAASKTPTVTLTPLPTPIWAEIQAGEANGANVRAEPGFSGKIIRSVLNGTLVEVLTDAVVVDNITWANIRFSDQTTGWIVRTLLLSSTPAPEW